MTNANYLVGRIVGQPARADVPPRVYDIVERHRQNLLNLANALISSGRSEDEVVAILQTASESFAIELKSKREDLRL